MNDMDTPDNSDSQFGPASGQSEQDAALETTGALGEIDRRESARSMPMAPITSIPSKPMPMAICWIVILISFACIVVMQQSSVPTSATKLTGSPESVTAEDPVYQPLSYSERKMTNIFIKTIVAANEQSSMPPAKSEDLLRNMMIQVDQMGMDSQHPDILIRFGIADYYFQQNQSPRDVDSALSWQDILGDEMYFSLYGSENSEPDDSPDAVKFRSVTDVIDHCILFHTQPTADQAILLHDELGWAGDCFVATFRNPSDPERAKILSSGFRLIMVMFILMVGLVISVPLGFVLFIIAVVQVARGRIRSRLQPKQLVSTISANVYAEAFAVYFASFAVFAGIASVVGGANTAVAGFTAVAAASVLGVGWPFWRCQSRRRVAHELGLSRGQGVVKEILCGVAGYIAGIPFFLVGIACTVILMLFYTSYLQSNGQVLEQGMDLSDPVTEMLMRGNPIALFGMFFLLSVFAPFFEETMFRGALFGSLRRYVPFLVAAPLMAFIFAAIHPQPLFAVPVLMSLAINFAIMREWRGSLIAPMTAHALHNGVIAFIVLQVVI